MQGPQAGGELLDQFGVGLSRKVSRVMLHGMTPECGRDWAAKNKPAARRSTGRHGFVQDAISA